MKLDNFYLIPMKKLLENLAKKKWILVVAVVIIVIVAMALLVSDGDLLKGALIPAVIQWN